MIRKEQDTARRKEQDTARKPKNIFTHLDFCIAYEKSKLLHINGPVVHTGFHVI